MPHDVVIKIVLVVGLAGAATLLIRGRTTALTLLLRRTLTLSVIALGVVAVLFPDLVTEVARAVGVGRGADLILYLLCITFLFVAIAIYLRLQLLHDRQVELARQHALLAAEVEALRAARTEPVDPD